MVPLQVLAPRIESRGSRFGFFIFLPPITFSPDHFSNEISLGNDTAPRVECGWLYGHYFFCVALFATTPSPS